MATPPMRGVGAVWNFCVPSVWSIVRAPCQRFVSTSKTQRVKVATIPQAAAVIAAEVKMPMMLSIIFKACVCG